MCSRHAGLRFGLPAGPLRIRLSRQARLRRKQIQLSGDTRGRARQFRKKGYRRGRYRPARGSTMRQDFEIVQTAQLVVSLGVFKG
jgi:hypothetical protein